LNQETLHIKNQVVIVLYLSDFLQEKKEKKKQFQKLRFLKKDNRKTRRLF
jgi:hypothetical protein